MRTTDAPVSRRTLLQASGASAGAALLGAKSALAQEGTPVTIPKPRARDLGVPFEGTPGPNNAITDVPGVCVGHVTLIDGDGPLTVGQGPVRTGVTCIVPRLDDLLQPVFAGVDVLNGNGTLTNHLWIEESGFIEGPITLTNTLSVGTAFEAISDVALQQFGLLTGISTVAETWDGVLNDISGRHVKHEHVVAALQGAVDGPVAEGNVGGGTGMICHDFKGGIGTSSRVLDYGFATYTLGVLVQANHGYRNLLRVAGVPVGAEFNDLLPELNSERQPGSRTNSIIVVIATDLPHLPHQLKRLAKRAALGIGVTGGIGENGSGDIMIAFSTAPVGNQTEFGEPVPISMLINNSMDFVMWQIVLAVEEAIVNALVAAETMTGVDGNTVYALPHERLQEILRKYNRLAA